MLINKGCVMPAVPPAEQFDSSRVPPNITVVGVPRQPSIDAATFLQRYGQGLDLDPQAEEEGGSTEEIDRVLGIHKTTDGELGKSPSYFDALPRPRAPLSNDFSNRYKALPGGITILKMADGTDITVNKTSARMH
jgi:hypothetical protein